MPQSSNEIPVDHVIGISIELGKPYAYDTQVEVYYSSGPSQLEPIDVPPIIGLSKDEALDFLTVSGFTGNINYIAENYTAASLVAKDTVMAIMVGGVHQETLPEKLAPDAAITLVGSTGFKDAVVDLPWPNTSLVIDVQVIINGYINHGLTQKFENGISPQYTTEKLHFVLSEHAVEVTYPFVVKVREHGVGDFKEYAVLRIDPVKGTVTMDALNEYVDGITPAPPAMITLPADLDVATMTKDSVRSLLEGLGFTVNELVAENEAPEGTVLSLECNGNTVVAGSSILEKSTITMHISGGPAGSGDEVVE